MEKPYRRHARFNKMADLLFSLFCISIIMYLSFSYILHTIYSMSAHIVLSIQARAEGERLFVQSKTDMNIVKYTSVRIRKIKHSRNRNDFG